MKSNIDGPMGGPCCAPVARGYRLLTFPDGSQAGVMGLDAIYEDMFRNDKQSDAATASEIVERLSADNYIAPGVRGKYEILVLEEYRKYCEFRIRR